MPRLTLKKIESPTLPKSHPLHTVYAARVGNTEFRIARDGKGWCVDLYEPVMGVWERASETYPTLTAAKAAFKEAADKAQRSTRKRANPVHRYTQGQRIYAQELRATERGPRYKVTFGYANWNKGVFSVKLADKPAKTYMSQEAADAAGKKWIEKGI